MSTLTDEIMAPVYARVAELRAAEQGRCPNISKGSTRVASPIEKFGQERRSDGKCGRVALLRNRADGATVAARLFCGTRACPDCGPLRRRRLAAHYTAAIGATPVVRFVVDRAAWSTAARRLSRAEVSYLRIPAPEAQYVVFASAGSGQPVTDLAAALAEAFGQMPLVDARGRPDRARVSSSRCWAENANTAVGKGQGDRESEAGWELLGFAGVTLGQVVLAARNQGLYLGPVEDKHLLPTWAEAHLLRLPPAGSAEYERFAKRIRLRWPTRQRQGERRAA